MILRKRDARAIAADVVEMRAAIAREKGDADPWDLKYAAGGLVDIEFIAQYLQLVHAATAPEILDTSTARMLEKAARAGVLKPEDAAVLRPAVLLFHDLTQILRLCLPGAFDPGVRWLTEIGKCRGAGVIGACSRIIVYCADKDGETIERIYIFPKEEVIKSKTVSIVKNPTKGIQWYEKYRLEEDIVIHVNDIFKNLK